MDENGDSGAAVEAARASISESDWDALQATLGELRDFVLAQAGGGDYDDDEGAYVYDVDQFSDDFPEQLTGMVRSEIEEATRQAQQKAEATRQAAADATSILQGLAREEGEFDLAEAWRLANDAYADVAARVGHGRPAALQALREGARFARERAPQTEREVVERMFGGRG